MGLEKAGKLNNIEITSGYGPAKASETNGWERLRKTSPKHRREKRPAWGTSKGPWGIPTPIYSNGCACMWLTGDYDNTCRLNSVNSPLNNSCNITQRPALISSSAQLNVSHGP